MASRKRTCPAAQTVCTSCAPHASQWAVGCFHVGRSAVSAGGPIHHKRLSRQNFSSWGGSVVCFQGTGTASVCNTRLRLAVFPVCAQMHGTVGASQHSSQQVRLCFLCNSAVSCAHGSASNRPVTEQTQHEVSYGGLSNNAPDYVSVCETNLSGNCPTAKN